MSRKQAAAPARKRATRTPFNIRRFGVGEFAAEADQVNRSGDYAAPAMAKHGGETRRDALLFERLTLLEVPGS